MGWKSLRAFKEYQKRCTNRGVARSEELKQRVTGILDVMRGKRLVDGFLPDPDSNTFSVTKVVSEEPIVRTFSVTLSLQGRNRARAKGIVNRFCIPPEMKTETIERKILELFEA
jgi:hypothetical protein